MIWANGFFNNPFRGLTLQKYILRERLAALSLEIRNYPTPIARCDLHLPALIEERARLLEQLKNLDGDRDAA